MTKPISIHLGPEPKTKVAWVKNTGDAIKKFGVPSESIEDSAHLAEVMRRCEEADRAKRIEERGTTDKVNPHVTDAGKDCARQLFYAATNTERSDPIDVSGWLKIQSGNGVGDKFAELYEKAGYNVVNEEHVSFDVPCDGEVVKVSGRIDHHILDEEKVVELKTTFDNSFKWMVARQQPGREEHRVQLLLYLHRKNLDGIPYKYGVLRYLVLDAPKGTPNPMSFRVDYNAEEAEWYLQRTAKIWLMAQRGEDPDIPPWFVEQFYAEGKMPLYPCSYCGWKSKCWGSFNAARKGAA